MHSFNIGSKGGGYLCTSSDLGTTTLGSWRFLWSDPWVMMNSTSISQNWCAETWWNHAFKFALDKNSVWGRYTRVWYIPWKTRTPGPLAVVSKMINSASVTEVILITDLKFISSMSYLPMRKLIAYKEKHILYFYKEKRCFIESSHITFVRSWDSYRNVNKTKDHRLWVVLFLSCQYLEQQIPLLSSKRYRRTT